MNLKQTIDELERQAKQYQQAADALRAIGQNGATPSASKQKGTKPAAKSSSKSGGSKSGKAKKLSTVSEETRAKISNALKDSHAAKKAAAG